MIKLHPRRILLKDREGRGEPVELESVERNLDLALRDCAIQERWLVDHTLVALQDCAAAMSGASTFDRDSLHLTVARMLVDAGYADVASRFAERSRIAEAVAGDASQAAWDSARVVALLEREFKSVRHLAPRLARKVSRRLESLGFSRVGDGLILELARHVLSEWSERERREERMANSGQWLMTPGFWQAALPPEVGALIEREALEIRPISELLPVVRLRLRLSRLFASGESRPLTDLRLFPVLAEACRVLAGGLESLLRQSGRADGKTRHPAHLTVLGLDRLLAAEFAGEGAGRRDRRRREIAGLFSEVLGRQLEHRVIVVFEG